MTTFETGATSHAVNDLILYTDNTRALAASRDIVYNKAKNGHKIPTVSEFLPLAVEAADAYKKEFPNDHSHISSMDGEQVKEFCSLYVADYSNWLEDHK